MVGKNAKFTYMELRKMINLQLPVEDVEYVVNLLAARPYSESHRVIDSIKIQINGVQHGNNDGSGGEDAGLGGQ